MSRSVRVRIPDLDVDEARERARSDWSRRQGGVVVVRGDRIRARPQASRRAIAPGMRGRMVADGPDLVIVGTVSLAAFWGVVAALAVAAALAGALAILLGIEGVVPGAVASAVLAAVFGLLAVGNAALALLGADGEVRDLERLLRRRLGPERR